MTKSRIKPLLEEIEKELKIQLHPMTWPINSGKDFKGVYNIHEKEQGKDLISMTDVLHSVNKDMKMVLVYGTADDISKPQITIDFYNLAKEKGFNVKLVEAKDAPHLDLDMTDASVDAIVEVVEED